METMMMQPATTTTTIPQGPLRRNSLHGSGKMLQRKNPTRIATKRWIRMKMPMLPRPPCIPSFWPSDPEGSTTGNRCFFARGNSVYLRGCGHIRGMINVLLNKIFGSKNERELKRLQPLVAEISAKEPSLARLSDLDLRAKAEEFKKRLADGATLDDILTDAFAVCREMAKRKLEMRHFDVQLIGGMVLHQGKIAEMKTGEGKTLVATLAVYLNALTGRGVHLVTVNDHLARRDSDWMGRIYKFLGLTVGVIQNSHGDRERQEAYRCDVTYGTNNEFGFDYLRDNMKFDLEAMVQRDPVYAIVDEVDSILIDEARTPLIISGPSEESVDKYYAVDRIIPRLTPETDFQVDEKQHTAVLTEEGVLHAEKLLGV